jgi:predicted XRE-type DNA-binding protein
LHCFQKKTSKTSKADLDLTTKRYRELLKERPPMSGKRFSRVWDAIEDNPVDAENTKLRSILMTALKDHITRNDMSQAQAAKLLDVTQPRISDLMRGKIGLFGLDALVNMAKAAGMHVEMRVRGAA